MYSFTHDTVIIDQQDAGIFALVMNPNHLKSKSRDLNIADTNPNKARLGVCLKWSRSYRIAFRNSSNSLSPSPSFCSHRADF